jgi:hypothetical protein
VQGFRLPHPGEPDMFVASGDQVVPAQICNFYRVSSSAGWLKGGRGVQYVQFGVEV